jgi:hypothetical protein
MQSTDNRRARRVVQSDGHVTSRQTYRIARQLADIAGIDWPETRAAASELIDHLETQRAALSGASEITEF